MIRLSHRSTLFAAALALVFPLFVHAHTGGNPPPVASTTTEYNIDMNPVATASSHAALAADQHQQQSQQSTASADNVGNQQQTAVDLLYERSAPSVAQGSLYVGECGGAGNAGGSRSTGAAFLGLAWTPNDCKLLLAASAYRSIGMADEACRMITGISAVRKRYKQLRLPPPDCQTRRPAESAKADVIETVPVEPPQTIDGPADPRYVTHEELARAFKRSLSK